MGVGSVAKTTDDNTNCAIMLLLAEVSTINIYSIAYKVLNINIHNIVYKEINNCLFIQ